MMTSSVERGIAPTTTHVTGTFLLLAMDVLLVVVVVGVERAPCVSYG